MNCACPLLVLFDFIMDWFDNFINQWPATLFSSPVSREEEFFFFFFPHQTMTSNNCSLFLYHKWKTKNVLETNTGTPCCHSVILNYKGQSPLLSRMVSALEWIEVQCLASPLKHLKISLTCLSSWNTFNRPFWTKLQPWSSAPAALCFSLLPNHQTLLANSPLQPCSVLKNCNFSLCSSKLFNLF